MFFSRSFSNSHQQKNYITSSNPGLEFKSGTGQILHIVANGSPPLQLLHK